MLTVRLADLDLRDGMTALDLGCGAGRHLHAMFYHAYVNAIGVDLGIEDVKRTRHGFESYPDIEPGSARRFGLAVADATRLPFPDKSFDVIVCSEVLEHIPDFGAALKECARLLKPGGRLAVTVPRYWPEWINWALEERYHNAPGGHVRIFRRGALRKAVESAGFTYRNGHHAHALHSPYWWLQCLMWDRREKSALVRAYRKLLEWDILKAPRLTRWTEAALNPVMGKSLVLYFVRDAA